MERSKAPYIPFFLREFSHGVAPPTSSSDPNDGDFISQDSDAVAYPCPRVPDPQISPADYAAATALVEFSDGKEFEEGIDYGSHEDDFWLCFPEGAIYKLRDYPDCTQIKVVVPGMGKNIRMRLVWVRDDDTGESSEEEEEEEERMLFVEIQPQA